METSGLELVMHVMSAQLRYKPTHIIMGFFQTSEEIIGFLICSIKKSNMKPTSNGSVGMNKPKLSVHSSILMDNGVKNAKLKKVHSE
jgi:hypothetical protein